MKKPHIAILRAIIESQSHYIDTDTAREAITELREKIEENEKDFSFDFDGNAYRIIHEAAIWGIYVEEIKNIVEECYDLNLDKIPNFIAVSIDWQQTAKNAYVDGYGHTFSGYDGSECEAGGYCIFRTN